MSILLCALILVLAHGIVAGQVVDPAIVQERLDSHIRAQDRSEVLDQRFQQEIWGHVVEMRGQIENLNARADTNSDYLLMILAALVGLVIQNIAITRKIGR